MSNVLIADDIDFEAYLRESDPAAKVRPAAEFQAGVLHVLAPAHESQKYPRLPFAGAWVDFRPGEVTLWGGFNGSGKSALQGQILAGFAEAGEPICIASFEMRPEKTLARIARQYTGKQTPSRTQVEGVLGKLQQLWLYDQQGTIKPDRMVAVIKHCADKLKIKHVAIDSLMKCVRGTDDYNGQKDFVDQLTNCARDYNIHIHLVVHLKKGEGDERMPTRMDISGTAAISDLVDNVLLVWRNKKKERQRDSGQAVDDSHPDAMLVCDKQRNGDWEGRVRLWYDRSSMRFSDHCVIRRGIAQAL